MTCIYSRGSRCYQECHTQLNSDLTFRSHALPDFIPQYEIEIQETKAMIERGKDQERSMWDGSDSSPT